MLYLLHMGNHPNLTYRGGQQPIIHLESDLGKAVEWAEASARRWAFTLSNAGAFYFEKLECCASQQVVWPWSFQLN